MALDLCDLEQAVLCQKSFDNEMFKWLVLRLLLQIADNTGGSGTDSAVVLEQAAITPVPVAYTDTGLLDGTFRLRHLHVNNQSDANVEISLDNGVTTAFTVLANSTLERDLGNFQAAAADDVQLRYQAATPWSVGTVYFDGSY